MTLGKQLRKAREKTDISLRQFAFKLGLSPTYLSKIERGELVPSPETIIRICNEIGLNGDIIALREGKTPKWIVDIQKVNAEAVVAYMEELTKEV